MYYTDISFYVLFVQHFNILITIYFAFFALVIFIYFAQDLLLHFDIVTFNGFFAFTSLHINKLKCNSCFLFEWLINLSNTLTP